MLSSPYRMSKSEITLTKLLLFLLGLALISAGFQGVFGSLLASVFAPDALDQPIQVNIKVPGLTGGL